MLRGPSFPATTMSSALTAAAARGVSAVPKRVLPGVLRCQTTGPTSTATEPPQPPPHRRTSGPPSRHKLFYRDIVPPLFRVLAYGSAVYFTLHLTWQYLDGREQKALETQVREEMEAQVRQKLESQGVVDRQTGATKGWWTWLSGR